MIYERGKETNYLFTRGFEIVRRDTPIVIKKALINAGFVDNKRNDIQFTLNDRPNSNINQSCEREAY